MGCASMTEHACNIVNMYVCTTTDGNQAAACMLLNLRGCLAAPKEVLHNFA
jgi:hypothetical protein